MELNIFAPLVQRYKAYRQKKIDEKRLREKRLKWIKEVYTPQLLKGIEEKTEMKFRLEEIPSDGNTIKFRRIYDAQADTV